MKEKSKGGGRPFPLENTDCRKPFWSVNDKRSHIVLKRGHQESFKDTSKLAKWQFERGGTKREKLGPLSLPPLTTPKLQGKAALLP